MVNIETLIDSVTVFSESSLVCRTGAFPADVEGETVDICVRDLPLALDDGSVQVGLDDGAAWAVNNVRVEVDSREAAAPARPEDRIRALEEELEEMDLRIAGVQRQLGTVTTWLTVTPPDPDEDTDFDLERRLFPFAAWQGFVRICGAHMARLQAKAQEHLAARARLQRELDALREDTLSRNPPREEDPALRYCKNAFVTLRRTEPAGAAVRGTGAVGESPGRLALSYTVQGARWTPLYKLEVSDSLRVVTLTMGAQVAQKSGEDWSGAALRFSSARLDRTVQLHDLPSRRIGRAQPQKPPSFRPKGAPASTLFESYDGWLAQASHEAPAASPVVELLSQCRIRLDDGASAALAVPPPPEASLGGAPWGSQGYAAGAEMDDICVEEAEAPWPEAASPPPPPRPAPMKAMALGAASLDAVMSPPPRARAPMELMRAKKSDAPSGAPPAEREALDDETVLVTDLPRRARAVEDYFRYTLEGVESPSARGRLQRSGELACAPAVAAMAQDIANLIGAARRSARIAPFPGAADAFHCVFHSRGRADVPCDGHPHVVDITEGTAQAQVVYRTVPMTDSKAFARLTVKNPFATPLPGGPVQLFIDGVFAFTTRMEGVGAEGQVAFPLGVEERLKVARTTTFRQEEKGLTGGTSVAAHAVQIHLRSHMPQPVDVEVFERIPVRDESEKKLEVKVVAVEPASVETEFVDTVRLRGSHVWNVRLEPAQDAYLRIEYQVIMPSKMEIVGGNRRV